MVPATSNISWVRNTYPAKRRGGSRMAMRARACAPRRLEAALGWRFISIKCLSRSTGIVAALLKYGNPSAAHSGAAMIARTLFDAEHDTFRESVRRFIDAEVLP